jgi:arginine N-succinyltransferase
MLEHEGFTYDRYVDIFDGGPTVTARTDDIETVRDARTEKIAEIGEGGTVKVLAAAGRLKDFRACCASIKRLPRKGILIDPKAAELLEVEFGDTLLTAPK